MLPTCGASRCTAPSGNDTSACRRLKVLAPSGPAKRAARQVFQNLPCARTFFLRVGGLADEDLGTARRFAAAPDWIAIAVSSAFKRLLAAEKNFCASPNIFPRASGHF